jgi:protein required for attachment to host cells
MHSSKLKLIAVFNSFHLELYEADNEKIKSGPEVVQLPFKEHHRDGKSSGLSQRISSHGGSFEPHTSIEDLEHKDASKMISDYLERKLGDKNEYKEFIAIGDPKTLGYFRQHVGSHVKRIMTKSIAKNLVHHDVKSVAHEVFGD